MYPCSHLLIRLSVCLSVYLSVCLSVCTESSPPLRPMQADATSHNKSQHCCVLLAQQCWARLHGPKSLTGFKLYATSANKCQYCCGSMQTDATCWTQQCCVFLANNVAFVCMGLKVWPVSNYTQQVPTLLWFHANGRKMLDPTMLRVVGQQCCVRLHGPLPSAVPEQYAPSKHFIIRLLMRRRIQNFYLTPSIKFDISLFDCSAKSWNKYWSI